MGIRAQSGSHWVLVLLLGETKEHTGLSRVSGFGRTGDTACHGLGQLVVVEGLRANFKHTLCLRALEGESPQSTSSGLFLFFNFANP